MTDKMKQANLVGPPDGKKAMTFVGMLASGAVIWFVMVAAGYAFLGDMLFLAMAGAGFARLFWTPRSMMVVQCPYCMSTVAQGATVCPKCQREFAPPDGVQAKPTTVSEFLNQKVL